MHTFTVEINFSDPVMPMTERSKYKREKLKFNTEEQALKNYKLIMQNILPKGRLYGLKIIDEKGIEYNQGKITWDRRNEQ